MQAVSYKLQVFASLISILFLFVPSSVFASLDMIALNVGEGQAVLFSRDGHGLLIDTGPVHRGSRLLAKLKAYNVEQLDRIILTHHHPDHAGGLFRLVEAFPRVEVIENGHRLPGLKASNTIRWTWEFLDQWENRQVIQAGDTLQWRGVRIETLWPQKIDGNSHNRNSLVLHLRYGGQDVLIMGDVGAGVEKELLSQGMLPNQVQVLLAGHHGSKDTSCEPFLQKVNPVHAIICIDENNLRGYPAEKTVKRLQKHSDTLWRTWVDGDVELTLYKDVQDTQAEK
jgi:competence protein ComEC